MELLEPISVASSTRSLYLAESGLTMNFNFLKTSMSKITNSRVFRAFLKPEYLSYYTILALIQGVDKMYIYSVGFIVQIQLNTPEMQRYDIQPEVFQAVQTSVFAMFSFLGRISSGAPFGHFGPKVQVAADVDCPSIWCPSCSCL